MKYQAIFFVTPGPEHDPLGYYLKLTEAIDAADQHKSEVYNEYAYEAYYSQKKLMERNQQMNGILWIILKMSFEACGFYKDFPQQRASVC